jgi:hypothetical protein
MSELTDIALQNWSIFTHDENSPEDVGRYVVDDNKTLIADCYADFPDPYLGLPAAEEYRRNARLISKAPQLLHDAEQVIASWERGDLAGAVYQLAATVALARGQS